jgi:predicted transcriptional regulator
MKNLAEINDIIRDHERRLAALEGKKAVVSKDNGKSWYRAGSTIEKVVNLVSEKFFNKPKTIGDIISELKSRDSHMKPGDLTLPLRRIVRKDLLRKTKKNIDGSSSKKWLYIKV